MKKTDEQKSRLYDALLADGVDNWQGWQGDNYQAVLEEIETESKVEETKSKCQELFEIISLNSEVDYPAGREAGSSVTLTEYGETEAVKWIIKNLLTGNK